ncbi:ThiF family adenylyltransferase [Candidatus Poseidoniaceae archaeon]|nr:ThiF family adenylyltransferase [Euryarchaeota archaeon]MDA9166641.1 ThiF family adenylyltransferase [Candidatus Poseidoniaceae archaeon]MDA9828740.1 ThiF family adenylyltransferase [Candidatus Poseidoniaceae archaeon]
MDTDMPFGNYKEISLNAVEIRSAAFLREVVSKCKWNVENHESRIRFSKEINNQVYTIDPLLNLEVNLDVNPRDISKKSDLEFDDTKPQYNNLSIQRIQFEVDNQTFELLGGESPILDTLASLILSLDNHCSRAEILEQIKSIKSISHLRRKIAVIGVGGIGTTLLELVIPALNRINLDAEITLMDGDVVEASNLGHQRFTQEQIGMYKVSALSSRHTERGEHVKLIPITENLRTAEQLLGYDLVVVCVDRPEPRRLVHALDVPWIDLRCSGDGWMILSSDSDSNLVAQMTPDHEPMSCQVEGALDAGNLEFGFSIAGTFGAQWILQQLRGRRAPLQSIGSLTYGSFEFPKVSSPSMEVKA